jgi:hypothetical protein
MIGIVNKDGPDAGFVVGLQPDPRDNVIKGLMEALNTIHARAITTRGDQAYREFPRFAEKVSRAAMARSKAVVK